MASGLLTGLGILGGAVLAGVIAYNEWQQRKAMVRTVSGQAHKREPSLNTDDAQAGHTAAELAALNAASVTQLAQTPRLDPLIDSVVSFDLRQPVYGEALLHAMPPTQRVGSKPFFIEAQEVNTGDWEYPRIGQRYSAVQAGVQLANRMGALNEIEFSEFVVKVQAYADALNAEVEFPDMLHEVARARELDEFASSADAQLEFRIHARAAAWSAGYIQQHAQQQGFVLGMRPGRMVYHKALGGSVQGHTVLLTLSFDTHAALAEDLSESAVREVYLLLDVPQVPREAHAYELMRDLAIKLAASMEGQIVDAQNKVITLDTMEAIGQGLESLYTKLDARDLSAGSPQARRLFA